MAMTRGAAGCFRAFAVSAAVSLVILAAVASAERKDANKVPTAEDPVAQAPEPEKPDWHAALGLQPGDRRADVHDAYKRLFPTLRAQRDSSPAALTSFINAQKAYDTLSHSFMREEVINSVNYWAEIEYLRSDDALRRFTELDGAGSSRLRVIFVTEKPDTKVYEALDTAVRLYGRVRVAQVSPASVADSTGAPGKFFKDLRVREGGVVIFDPLSKAKNITYRRSRVVEDLEHVLDVGGEKSSVIARVQELTAQTYAPRCSAAESNRCEWSLVVATDEQYEQQGENLQKIMKEFSEACKKMQVDTHPNLVCFWLRLDGGVESMAWRAFLNRHSVEPLEAGKPVAFALKRSASGPGIAISPPGVALPETIHSLQTDENGGRLSTDEHARWWTFDGPSIYALGLIRWFEKVVTVEPQATSKLPPFPLWKMRMEPDMAVPDMAMRYFQNIKDVPLAMPSSKVVPMAVGAGIASLALPLSLYLCCCVRKRKNKHEVWTI